MSSAKLSGQGLYSLLAYKFVVIGEHPARFGCHAEWLKLIAAVAEKTSLSDFSLLVGEIGLLIKSIAQAGIGLFARIFNFIPSVYLYHLFVAPPSPFLLVGLILLACVFLCCWPLLWNPTSSIFLRRFSSYYGWSGNANF